MCLLIQIHSSFGQKSMLIDNPDMVLNLDFFNDNGTRTCQEHRDPACSGINKPDANLKGY